MVEYSVVIPTYKGSGKLPTALDSITRQSVSKDRFEVIIVNDGGSPEEVEKLESLRKCYGELDIKLIHLPLNLGPAIARNVGIKKAIGSVVFFTDDDCEVPALWMATHLSIYESCPEIGVVGGWYSVPLCILNKNIFEALMTWRRETSFSLYRTQDSRVVPHHQISAVNTANLSAKRYVLSTILFDEHFKAAGSEDIDFMRRILDNGFIVRYIPQFVIHHKILDFRSFIRLARSRGFGRYVFRLINFSGFEGNSSRATMEYIQLQFESMRLRPFSNFSLSILNRLYRFVCDSWLYRIQYANQYKRHRKNVRLWNTMTAQKSKSAGESV